MRWASDIADSCLETDVTADGKNWKITLSQQLGAIAEKAINNAV
jgi:hypothetical protein